MKIKITEEQYKRLMSKINESSFAEKYRNDVKVSTSYPNKVLYKGFEIDSILTPNITVVFDIDMYYKQLINQGAYLQECNTNYHFIVVTPKHYAKYKYKDLSKFALYFNIEINIQ